MDTYELLVRARDIFAERGGAKHVLENIETGKVCARGALNIAATGDAMCWGRGNGDWCDADEILSSLVPEKDIASFNNSYYTIKDDVLAVFDKAIFQLEEKVI